MPHYNLPHLAVLGYPLDLMPCQRPQERCLPCPVAPNEAVPPPKGQHHGGISDEVLASVGDVEVVQVDVLGDAQQEL